MKLCVLSFPSGQSDMNPLYHSKKLYDFYTVQSCVTSILIGQSRFQIHWSMKKIILETKRIEKSKVHKVHKVDPLNCLLIIVSVKEKELHVSLGQSVLASPGPHDVSQKAAWTNYLLFIWKCYTDILQSLIYVKCRSFSCFPHCHYFLLNVLNLWMHRSTTVFCP